MCIFNLSAPDRPFLFFLFQFVYFNLSAPAFSLQVLCSIIYAPDRPLRHSRSCLSLPANPFQVVCSIRPLQLCTFVSIKYIPSIDPVPQDPYQK